MNPRNIFIESNINGKTEQDLLFYSGNKLIIIMRINTRPNNMDVKGHLNQISLFNGLLGELD